MKKIQFTLLVFIFSILISFNVNSKNNYFSSGENFFIKKNYDKSKFQFEKDIVFNPKNEKSYLYLAKIYKMEKNDKFQEQNLNTVILLDPKNEEALYLLALLKIKQSNFERSKELIQIFKKVCNKICFKEEELSKKLKDLQTN